MKLATLRTPNGTIAVVVGDDSATEISGVADVGELVKLDDWRMVTDAAAGTRNPPASINSTAWAPVIPSPGKILCAGPNYRAHILEMGRTLPDHPTFFAKFAEALIGANDEIELAPETSEVDWEGELAVVVGTAVRRANLSEAAEAIAGYAVLNDVSMCDFQYRTLQWLQGKTFENTTPFGHYLVTTDEWTPGPTLRTQVDGELMQEASATRASPPAT